jgi:hypothetical protein
MARTDRFLSCLLPPSPLVASVRRAANLLSTFLSREYQQHYQGFAPPIHQPRNSLDDYHASTCSSRCKAAFKLRIRCLTLRYNLSSSSYLIIPLFLFIARPLGSRPDIELSAGTSCFSLGPLFDIYNPSFNDLLHSILIHCHERPLQILSSSPSVSQERSLF